jgi:glycosyltransferase involved in cell wall biosynthesis
MQKTQQFRPLLIAEAANPEWTSVPLVGWSHSRAIHSLTGGHIVTQVRNQAAFERAGVDPTAYTTIDSESIARPLYRFAEFLRGGSNKGWTTVAAVQTLSYRYFEHLVWKKFETRLRRGEFDIVHRITPLSPTTPSSIAAKVSKLGIPFILGPLNGGLPWRREFDSERRREREWLSYIRGAYKLMPGYRSTRKNAAAIICGSKATMQQMPEWCRGKCVYIPENGIDPMRFPEPKPKLAPRPMRVAFAGRLVPYKGADMLLEAAAPLIKTGLVTVDIIGDGPELRRLVEIVQREGIKAGVDFAGWIPHEKLHERLAEAHVLGFPSIREFGGAIVLEAMALRLVPIVIDYGGPGELVSTDSGLVIPIGNRQCIIRDFRAALTGLCDDWNRLDNMATNARSRVISQFTWHAKAVSMLEVYQRVRAENRTLV